MEGIARHFNHVAGGSSHQISDILLAQFYHQVGLHILTPILGFHDMAGKAGVLEFECIHQ